MAFPPCCWVNTVPAAAPRWSQWELASLDLEDQVLDLDASGRYVAVLTAAGLTLYTKDLQLYDALENTMGARSVVLRSDGTAFLVGGETARLYIPG